MNSSGITSSELKWVPDGFHFLDPELSLQRRETVRKIVDFFIKKGYREVTLPSFDFTSTFSGHISSKEQSRILKSRDLSGNEISPSVDLTLQVVKGMAGFVSKKGNQNLFYIGSVIKDHSKTNADRREILQAGAEIIGHSNTPTMKMLLTHIDEILIDLEVDEKFILVLGNTKMISFISERFGLSKAYLDQISSLLYSKNIPGLTEFLTGVEEIPEDVKQLLIEIPLCFDVTKLKDLIFELSLKYNLNLDSVVNESIEILDFGQKEFKNLEVCLDYSLIRDVDYYTGFVFHVYIHKFPYPIITGGAYDNLFEKFAGEPRKACGFALNIDILEEVKSKLRR